MMDEGGNESASSAIGTKTRTVRTGSTRNLCTICDGKAGSSTSSRHRAPKTGSRTFAKSSGLVMTGASATRRTSTSYRYLDKHLERASAYCDFSRRRPSSSSTAATPSWPKVEVGGGGGERAAARVEQIKTYKLLDDEWQPGGGELTPTMKVKRSRSTRSTPRRLRACYT